MPPAAIGGPRRAFRPAGRADARPGRRPGPGRAGEPRELRLLPPGRLGRGPPRADRGLLLHPLSRPAAPARRGRIKGCGALKHLQCAAHLQHPGRAQRSGASSAGWVRGAGRPSGGRGPGASCLSSDQDRGGDTRRLVARSRAAPGGRPRRRAPAQPAATCSRGGSAGGTKGGAPFAHGDGRVGPARAARPAPCRPARGVTAAAQRPCPPTQTDAVSPRCGPRAPEAEERNPLFARFARLAGARQK